MLEKFIAFFIAIFILFSPVSMAGGKGLTSGDDKMKNAAYEYKDILIKNFNRINPPAKADISAAEAVLADLKSDGSFQNIDYADPTRGAWKGMAHWKNLHILSAAWHATSDLKFRDGVIAGLNYWATALPENPNWWWQMIGVPLQAITILNNMHGDIPDATLRKLRKFFDRSNYRAPHGGRFTGQNLFNIALIQMWKGIYYNNIPMVENALKYMISLYCVAPRGKEGLQEDSSFHQHGPQQQFGNYGREYFINSVKFLALLEGTPLELPKANEELIHRYFFDGLRWTLYKNNMDYLACGRQIVKNYPKEKYESIAHVVKFFSNCNDARKRAESFFAADNVLSGSRYFYCSDHLIQRRKDFSFSFKMSSLRTTGSESTNSENLQGIHLGHGVMQYQISGDEYQDMAGLWDWHRLPGLTAVYGDGSLRPGPHSKNLSPDVGGVDDGINSGSMLNLQLPELEFNKSVALFDKTAVFNLSDVKNKTSFPVNTTIDSKRYTTPVEVIAAGKKVVFTDGIHQVPQISRIVCGKTAYTFPIPQDLTIAIEEKDVEWNKITIWADGRVSGKTVTIYNTNGDDFSWIVSPAEELPEIESTRSPGFYHAVTDKKSGITSIFFFAPGEAEIPGLGKVSCDRKAAVMITGEAITLAETEQNGRKVKFSLNGKIYNFPAGFKRFAGKSFTLFR